MNMELCVVESEYSSFLILNLKRKKEREGGRKKQANSIFSLISMQKNSQIQKIQSKAAKTDLSPTDHSGIESSGAL